MYPSIDFPLSQGEDLEALRISVVLPCAGEASLCKLFDFFHQPTFAVSVLARQCRSSNMAFAFHGTKFLRQWILFTCFHMFSHNHCRMDMSKHRRALRAVFRWQGLYALNTVRAVYESLPPGVLHEIIVVDDGTEPPLSQSFLTPDVLEKFQVTILRHVPWLHLASTCFNS